MFVLQCGRVSGAEAKEVESRLERELYTHFGRHHEHQALR